MKVRGISTTERAIYDLFRRNPRQQLSRKDVVEGVTVILHHLDPKSISRSLSWMTAVGQGQRQFPDLHRTSNKKFVYDPKGNTDLEKFMIEC
jgi:hypothetical protein